MEEEEDEDDEEGVGAGSNVGGLDGFGSEIPGGAFTSPPVALFSRSFFPGRRRRLATEEEQGEEVEEDVLEVGVAFFALRRVGLVTLAGARTFLCFCWLALPGSLPRDCRDSGSEHGFRNGERLSLSRRNTTAIEPPTTEEEPPTAPPGPMWSTPSFPAAPGAAVPVVLLTPSRTRTDTFDCNLAFFPPSFLECPDRPDSFLPPFSRSFSFLFFWVRLADVAGLGREGAKAVGERGGGDDEVIRRLLLVLALRDVDSDWLVFLAACDFFLGRWVGALGGGLLLGGGEGGGSGDRRRRGESSNEG